MLIFSRLSPLLLHLPFRPGHIDALASFFAIDAITPLPLIIFAIASSYSLASWPHSQPLAIAS
jgi:hypothetical protein